MATHVAISPKPSSPEGEGFQPSPMGTLIVEEDRRNQLDAKLKEMIKHLEQAEAKHKEPITQSGTGNAIRRREGQKAKRFYV